MAIKISALVILFCFSLSSSSAQQINKEGSDYRYQDSTYSKTELGDIMSQNIEAKYYYDRFITKRKYATDGLIGGTILMAIGGGYALYTYNKGCQGGPCLGEIIIWSGAGLIGAIIDFIAMGFEVSAYINLNHALDIFNTDKSISNTQNPQLHLGATVNGLGLILSF